MILAGDIGGTKTNLGLFAVDGDKLTSLALQSFPSKKYSGLETIVDEFMAGATARVQAACFGVAGPVIEGRLVTPNLPWVVESSILAERLQLNSIELINDLEATAHGIPELKPEEFVTLNEGRPEVGNAALIAAGTGLGVASLFWNGERHVPSASEGGHADFPPRDQLEIELLQYLLSKTGHVSVERLLSGPGLVNIYDFLRSVNFAKETPSVADSFAGNDPSSVIANAAMAHGSELCVKALDMFVSIYGAAAGNVALLLKAVGGIYIGGGIAPKIIEKLKDGPFMRSFTAKGRLSNLLEDVPVRVIMNDKTALLGAARVAARGLGRGV
ncbi:MAG TPA: glucokinase [Blastocatellia bacterium]|nr:glucokinase [Blastocatellia bacterium]